MRKKDRKGRGFTGELFLEIPRDSIARCEHLPLIRHLYITKMGFYPRALHHHCQRPAGFSQTVMLYCTDGEGTIQLEKKKIVLQAGQVFVLPAGMPHSYAASKHNPWTIHWFHLYGAGAADVAAVVMGEAAGRIQAASIPYSEARIKLFQKIADTFKKGYSTSNLLFANLSLSSFLSSFASPDNFMPAHKPTVADPVLLAIDYMQQHLHHPVTLDNLARAVNLSVSFFCRKFKHDTGYAPIEYYNHLRMQKACQLLHFSSLRINEVAAQIGIDDPFYFSRLFKKQLGVSPLDYRRKEGVAG